LQELTTKIVIQEEKLFPNDGKFTDPLLYMKALRDSLIQFENADKQIFQEPQGFLGCFCEFFRSFRSHEIFSYFS
jgi:hypothetical protein